MSNESSAELLCLWIHETFFFQAMRNLKIQLKLLFEKILFRNMHRHCIICTGSYKKGICSQIHIISTVWGKVEIVACGDDQLRLGFYVSQLLTLPFNSERVISISDLTDPYILIKLRDLNLLTIVMPFFPSKKWNVCRKFTFST